MNFTIFAGKNIIINMYLDYKCFYWHRQSVNPCNVQRYLVMMIYVFFSPRLPLIEQFSCLPGSQCYSVLSISNKQSLVRHMQFGLVFSHTEINDFHENLYVAVLLFIRKIMRHELLFCSGFVAALEFLVILIYSFVPCLDHMEY